MTIISKLIGWGILGLVTVGTFWVSGRGIGAGAIHNSSIMKAPQGVSWSPQRPFRRLST